MFGQSRIDGRNLDILPGRGGSQEIIALKNEAEGFASERSQLIGRKMRCLIAQNQIATGSRAIEAADDIHQGGLAGAGLSHDRDEFAAMNLERHPVQRPHCRAAVLVMFMDVLQF